MDQLFLKLNFQTIIKYKKMFYIYVVVLDIFELKFSTEKPPCTNESQKDDYTS